MFFLCVYQCPYFTLALLSGTFWLPWKPGAYRARASLVPIPFVLVVPEGSRAFTFVVFWIQQESSVWRIQPAHHFTKV